LTTRVAIHDRDTAIPHKDQETTPVRVSSSVIRGHRGDLRGALLLVSDMTTIKRLEDQVRRTDRLSSLGTLSAGMAHEIKNPLVTIKTFTQLLPERHDDEEFRETFFNLIGSEVTRIDSIVNRLLGFARPAKPEFLVMSLHSAIEDSLQLVQEQAKSKGIELIREFAPDGDLVNGDGELLKQAFVNFFLNAVESMDEGGHLVVSTERVEPLVPNVGAPNHGPHMHVSIRDSGGGIREEDVNHVFDPFFTTKTSGTGLGLSVAHGILQEHKVGIDVDSQIGVGTTFHLTFPLMATEEAAA
jgi:two-component system nitrogen regulation sensor histidine kinase GlnL